MRELLIAPEIHSFPTFREFAEVFRLESDDVILTNEYIYDPIIKAEKLNCAYIFQEQYGSGEPSDQMVDAILKEVNKLDCKRVIAIGGGTILDIAKVLVLKVTEGVDALYEQEQLEKFRKLIIVPTTCGTGSEVTNLSIINRIRKGTKMGLASTAMYADDAVLIPEFLKTLPYYVFAASSIDALIHAVESYLGPKRTDYSAIFSAAAIKAILAGYCQIVKYGQEHRFELGEQFLKASNYAGIAFGNSGCAAVHAMSYALGGKYHVPHGESNYQFFTEVLREYKRKQPGGLMESLETMIGQVTAKEGFQANGQDGIGILENLLSNILEKKKMREYGVTQEDIASFARSTIVNQQRLLANNYTVLSQAEIEAIYQARL